MILELTYCDKNPGICENNAKCVSLTVEDGNYRCLCREGFTGRNCEVPEIAVLQGSTLASTTVPTTIPLVSEETGSGNITTEATEATSNGSSPVPPSKSDTKENET